MSAQVAALVAERGMEVAAGGSGELVVSFEGAADIEGDAATSLDGAGWTVRGIAVGGLFRLWLEYEIGTEAKADPGGVDAMVAALAGVGAGGVRVAAVGPDRGRAADLVTAVLRRYDAMRAAPRFGFAGWVPDHPAVRPGYCETELSAAVALDEPRSAVLAAFLMRQFGKRHDSALLAAVRHEVPLGYAARSVVIASASRLAVRLRVGGTREGCAQRQQAIVRVLSTPWTGAEILRSAGEMRARLTVDVLAGGPEGAAALSLIALLDPRDVDGAQTVRWEALAHEVALVWPRLSWRCAPHEICEGDLR